MIQTKVLKLIKSSKIGLQKVSTFKIKIPAKVYG